MEINEGCGSYYDILGVSLGSSHDDIRRAYKRLAMQWHPDKWTRTPMLLSEAKRKFQQIQEAYSVLSDGRKRTMYDAGLYNPEEDEREVEGFADFLHEMVSLVKEVQKEGKSYSMEDLQSMFWEMAQSFKSPNWYTFPENPVYDPSWLSAQLTFDDSGTLGSASRDPNLFERDLHLHFPGFEMYGRSHVCR